MVTIDLKREMKPFYSATADEAVLVDVPPLLYVMIDGHGDPNTAQEYVAAVEALYGLAYTIKFRLKKSDLHYAVMPLEGLWWVDDMRFFSPEHKADWDWTMMIVQPPEVTPDLFAAALEDLRLKKPQLPLDRLALSGSKKAAQPKSCTSVRM